MEGNNYGVSREVEIKVMRRFIENLITEEQFNGSDYIARELAKRFNSDGWAKVAVPCEERAGYDPAFYYPSSVVEEVSCAVFDVYFEASVDMIEKASAPLMKTNLEDRHILVVVSDCDEDSDGTIWDEGKVFIDGDKEVGLCVKGAWQDCVFTQEEAVVLKEELAPRFPKSRYHILNLD